MELIDRQLRYFLVIAELESLSKAAETLNQTQSSLSKQLAALEGFLGQPLFTRTGRGLRLTEAGIMLRVATLRAYKDIDGAVETVRRRGVTHGTLRVASVHTLTYYFVRDVVTRYVAEYPLVNLSLMGRSSPDVVQLVESGRADIGIVYDSAVDSGILNTSPLFDDEMAFIVREDNPRSGPLDLTSFDLRLVGFQPQYALRKMIHSAGLNPVFAAEAETIDLILQLVASGIGESILPSRLPEKLLHDYGLKKLAIAKPLLKRKVVLIERADKTGTHLAAQWVRCAKEVASDMERGLPE